MCPLNVPALPNFHLQQDEQDCPAQDNSLDNFRDSCRYSQATHLSSSPKAPWQDC